MDKISVLHKTDEELLREFSKRCIGRIERHRPAKLFLSPFRHFLEANVGKEIEKDRLIIEHAAKAHQKGDTIEEIDVFLVFEKTKEIDRVFVEKVSVPPLSIKVRYEDIGETRRKRIVLLSGMVFDLLGAWGTECSFAGLVRNVYSETRFSELIGEMLHLYNLETRLLGASIRLLPPADRAKDFLMTKLFITMEDVARDLVRDCARGIYSGGAPCATRT